jgi:hypothetical protein
MKKDLKILVLVLLVPLMVFGTGYAYAQQTISSYINYSSVDVPAGQSSGAVIAYCNAGDFATGGSSAKEAGLIMDGSAPFPIALGATPQGWTASGVNPTGAPLQLTVYAVCMSPITLAGIGVPEFGSMYMAIILAAAVYFALTRLKKPSLIPAK